MRLKTVRADSYCSLVGISLEAISESARTHTEIQMTILLESIAESDRNLFQAIIGILLAFRLEPYWSPYRSPTGIPEGVLLDST